MISLISLFNVMLFAYVVLYNQFSIQGFTELMAKVMACWLRTADLNINNMKRSALDPRSVWQDCLDR